MAVRTWLLLAGIVMTAGFSLGYGIPDAVEEIRILSEDARTVYAVLEVEAGDLVLASQGNRPPKPGRDEGNGPTYDDDGWGFTMPDNSSRGSDMPRRDDDGWGFTMSPDRNNGSFSGPRPSEAYASREERVRILIYSNGRPRSYSGLMDSGGTRYWVLWRNQPIELEEFLREVWTER